MSKDKKVNWLVLDEFSPNIRHLIIALFISSVFIVISSIYMYLTKGYWIFIVWNLFLAGLPLAITYLLHRSTYNIVKWILGGAWLLFFPNAPYLITDLIHIKSSRYFSYETGYITNTFYWLNLATLFFMVIVGCLLAFCSFLYMQNLVKKHLGNFLSWVFVGIVSLLSGFAIYIGRFMRFNSWDIFTRPFYMIGEILNSISLNTIILYILFGIMTFIFYLFFHLLCYNKEQRIN